MPGSAQAQLMLHQPVPVSNPEDSFIMNESHERISEQGPLADGAGRKLNCKRESRHAQKKQDSASQGVQDVSSPKRTHMKSLELLCSNMTLEARARRLPAALTRTHVQSAHGVLTAHARMFVV